MGTHHLGNLGIGSILAPSRWCMAGSQPSEAASACCLRAQTSHHAQFRPLLWPKVDLACAARLLAISVAEHAARRGQRAIH
eukprot:scaffold190174_cov29-Tisochrysis_lutea.AAC.2